MPTTKEISQMQPGLTTDLHVFGSFPDCQVGRWQQPQALFHDSIEVGQLEHSISERPSMLSELGSEGCLCTVATAPRKQMAGKSNCTAGGFVPSEKHQKCL